MTTQPNNNDTTPPGGDDDSGSEIPDVIDLGAADEALSEAAISHEEHQKIKAERDRLLYAVADSHNMRKRLQAEKEQAVQYANAVLMKLLIPIIDNFERALSVDPEKIDGASILKGLQIVHDQLMNELSRQHVEVIDPQRGDLFDPTRHEALMQMQDAEVEPNHIVQVLTRGYAMHGRTLRPAGVMVAK